jgi:hypothetical protein
MGIRFDLQTANWLAYLIERNAPVPRMEDPVMEREALQLFLSNLGERFYSSRGREQEFKSKVDKAYSMLHEIDRRSSELIPPSVLSELRADLCGRPWTALIVPSGNDQSLDAFLSSKGFLRQLIDIPSDEPGLLLQLEGNIEERFSLTDVFPGFRKALAECTR